jgi:hypothetical protein
MRAPILDSLRSILLAVQAGQRAMAAGGKLNPTELAPFDHISSWWFSEEYVGHSLTAVERFAETSCEYSKIPSGIGQAIARHQWVADRNALREGEDAEAAMRVIHEMAGKIYAE